MASVDPELRMRQLARRRTAYEASPDIASAGVETRAARHARAHR